MIRTVLAILLCACATPVWGQQEPTNLQLTLPPKIHAVAGIPMSVYFDNIVLTQSPEDYRFEVTCDVGSSVDRYWTVTPTDQDTGDHSFQVSLYTADNKLLESQSSVLSVTADLARPAAEPVRLMIIGDSLTHASQYPNEVARLLSRNENHRWKMLGTHKPPAAEKGVVHEGYGGWTWARFVTKFEANPDGTHKKRSSPFVFLSKSSSPQLDMNRYFAEDCLGERPTHVVIMLGINDCFSAPPDNVAGTDKLIDTMFAHADQLLEAIRGAASLVQIGFCLTTPPNARQEAFQANYKDRYTRWGWKRIQHRLVQRQLQYVKANADPLISSVPTQLNLDPIQGYPENNGVHPNETGYKQIGASVYAWLSGTGANHPNDFGHRVYTQALSAPLVDREIQAASPEK